MLERKRTQFLFVQSYHPTQPSSSKKRELSKIRAHVASATSKKFRPLSSRTPPRPRAVNSQKNLTINLGRACNSFHDVAQTTKCRSSTTKRHRQNQTLQPRPESGMIHSLPSTMTTRLTCGIQNLDLPTCNKNENCRHLPNTDVTDAFPSKGQHLKYRALLPLVQDAFSGIRTDPFHCIPASNDKRVAESLDFLLQNLGPGIARMCYLFDFCDMSRCGWENLADELCFNGHMAVIQLLYEQLRSPGCTPSTHVLVHRGKAIAAVRQKISKTTTPFDDNLVLAIIFLALLEAALNNTAALETHKKMIAGAVSGRGGFGNFTDGSFVKSLLLQAETVLMLDTGESLFAKGDRQYPSPAAQFTPYSPQVAKIIHNFAPGFRKLAYEGNLSLEMLQLIAKAQQLSTLPPHRHHEFFTAGDRSSRRNHDYTDVCPTLRYCDQDKTNLEHLICMTIVCYIFTAFGQGPSGIPARTARHQLTRKLQLNTYNSPVETRCSKWMWIITIDSWKIGSDLDKPGKLLLLKLQTLHPEMRDVEVAASVARDFMWTRELDRSIRDYWNMYTSLRQ